MILLYYDVNDMLHRPAVPYKFLRPVFAARVILLNPDSLYRTAEHHRRIANSVLRDCCTANRHGELLPGTYYR